MPAKRNPPNAMVFHTHFVETLNLLQYAENDAEQIPQRAVGLLASLNNTLIETFRLRKKVSSLPESLSLETETYLSIIWIYGSDIFFRGWTAVRKSTGKTPPKIGRGWRRKRIISLTPPPDLALFRASIQQFLTRYRVPIEFHALRLLAFSGHKFENRQFLEIGWPGVELASIRDQIEPSDLDDNGSDTVGAQEQDEFEKPSLISKSDLAKKIQKRTGRSHTIAYKLIRQAEESGALNPRQAKNGRCNVAYREREANHWLKGLTKARGNT